MLIKHFEEQVKARPGKVAVKSVDTAMTYDDLNQCANRLARVLPDRSAPGQSPAALLLGHNHRMIVGIIGVLKAGGIYIPFDPSYPEERLIYMLKDSAAGSIITDNRNVNLALKLVRTVNPATAVINLDTLDEGIPAGNPGIYGDPGKAAYILYTSGSTGRPKGVVQTQRNIFYYVSQWNRRFSVTPADRMAQFASFSHDGAIPDIYSALLNGATLYPFDVKGSKDSAAPAAWLINEDITIWHSVPTLYRYFVNTLQGDETFKNLRLIVLGGEPVRKHDVLMFKKNFPHSFFANIYGQTESTVTSIWMISPDHPFEKVIIGEPIGETELLIVDKQGMEVEEHESGEIVAACHFLSPGYLNNPEITAKVYTQDRGLGSLYWTGDLGRLLPQGEIEILGRQDFQVKVRGFRIEPGEIETQLLLHPAVQEAVVVAREVETTGLSGDHYLCAYVVTAADFQVSALRPYLAQKLPDYMIPTFFIPLQHMPLTANNKINRQALPPPAKISNEAYAPPENREQEKLVKIWAEVLETEKEHLSIDAGFFELGGHSLKAIDLLARIRKEFKLEIPINEMFQAPTIRGLAQILKTKNRESLQPLAAVEKREYYPLAIPQRKALAGGKTLAPDTRFNMTSVFVIKGVLVEDKFARAIRSLVQRHEILRTGFGFVNGEAVQIIADHVEFRVNSRECSEKEAAAIINEAFKPFDLTHPPLLRVTLLKIKDYLENPTYHVLFDIHHIAADAVSIRIMIDDFTSLYRDLPLEPLPIQFKDYAVWQDRLLTGNTFQGLEKYWLNRMDNFRYTRLPADLPGLSGISASDCRELVFEPYIYRKINDFCQKNKITRFIFLIAVLQVILIKETRQTDLTLGARVATRDREELKNLVGVFLSKLLIRSIAETTDTFLDHLVKVNQTVLEALGHALYPYELLDARLRETRPFTDHSGELISILVNYQPPAVMNSNRLMSQLKFEIRKPTRRYSKYDIDLFIIDGQQSMVIQWFYKSHIYKEERIKRIVDTILLFVHRVLENGMIRLEELVGLPPTEK